MIDTQKIREALADLCEIKQDEISAAIRRGEYAMTQANERRKAEEALRLFDEMTDPGMVCVRVEELRSVFDDNITTEEFFAARGRLAEAIKRHAEAAAMAAQERK